MDEPEDRQIVYDSMATSVWGGTCFSATNSASVAGVLTRVDMMRAAMDQEEGEDELQSGKEDVDDLNDPKRIHDTT